MIILLLPKTFLTGGDYTPNAPTKSKLEKYKNSISIWILGHLLKFYNTCLKVKVIINKIISLWYGDNHIYQQKYHSLKPIITGFLSWTSCSCVSQSMLSHIHCHWQRIWINNKLANFTHLVHTQFSLCVHVCMRACVCVAKFINCFIASVVN